MTDRPVAPPGRPRKRFGQHFLHDPAVVARIVSAVAPAPGDRILEIGPGTGVLTAALLERVGHLDAVEIDRDLAALLDESLRPHGLRVHCADALAFDPATLLSPGERPRPGERGVLRVVGNLPYNISTPLLFHLLRSRQLIRDMHVMLQREVVDRLAAPPGGKRYGRLSVMVQVHCEVQALFRVGPGAFRPPPKVDSAVVRLLPRAALPLPEQHLPALEQVVSHAFARRRKTLRNALAGLLGGDHIVQAGLDPGVRPETLSVQDFVALAGMLAAVRACG